MRAVLEEVCVPHTENSHSHQLHIENTDLEKKS